jgi:hypothetical protein
VVGVVILCDTFTSYLARFRRETTIKNRVEACQEPAQKPSSLLTLNTPYLFCLFHQGGRFFVPSRVAALQTLVEWLVARKDGYFSAWANRASRWTRPPFPVLHLFPSHAQIETFRFRISSWKPRCTVESWTHVSRVQRVSVCTDSVRFPHLD